MAYTLLFAYSLDDPIHTCHKIVKWKTYLQFPGDDEVELSTNAIDIMKKCELTILSFCLCEHLHKYT
jgi:hypothetical protein